MVVRFYKQGYVSHMTVWYLTYP